MEMDRKHILVVDDERNMLRTLAFILEAADYRVTTAEDGRKAMEKIQAARASKLPIDLLILDIQMPGVTGMELLDDLNCLRIEIPVFVITGYGDKAMVVELLRRGCTEYLDKPFDDEEFLRRVASCFGQRALAQ